ncbi:hypothetical protein [Jatrophihabitans fulvus]
MSSRLAATAAGLSLAVAAFLAFAAPALADGAAGGTSYRWVGNSLDDAADNHSWTDGRNWSPTGVPGNGDSVRVEGPQDACTAHVDHVPSVTLSSLEVVPGRSSFGDPCGTSIAGGPVTVTGSFLWSGGTIDSDVTLAASATGAIADAPVGLHQYRNITVQGSLDVSGTAVDKNGDGVVDTSWTIEPGRRLTVATGGTLTTRGANDFSYYSCCVTPGRVVNNGTIRVDGGATVIDHLAFDQKGRVVVGAGSALVSHGGVATAASGSTWSGAGQYRLRSTVESHFTGTQKLSDGFQLNLGTSGSDLAGSQFGGTFSVTGNGTLGWYGGTLQAGLTIGKGTDFAVTGVASGNNKRLLLGRDYTPGGSKSVSVVNHGTTFIGNGAALDTRDLTRFVNASDGVLELGPGARLDSQVCCVSPDSITNQGTLRLTQATFAAAAVRPVVLRNISFRNTGRLELPAGRELQVLGGAPATLGRSTTVGSGRLVLDTPTIVSGGTTLANRPSIGLNNTTLDLRGTTSVRGYVLFTGGTVVNRDVLTISSNSATRFSTTGNFTQVAGATTVLDAGPRGIDVIAVSRKASIAGTVTVRNASKWAPANGKRLRTVSALGGLSWAGKVVTVRGWVAPRVNHWVPSKTRTLLTLVARAG